LTTAAWRCTSQQCEFVVVKQRLRRDRAAGGHLREQRWQVWLECACMRACVHACAGPMSGRSLAAGHAHANHSTACTHGEHTTITHECQHPHPHCIPTNTSSPTHQPTRTHTHARTHTDKRGHTHTTTALALPTPALWRVTASPWPSRTLGTPRSSSTRRRTPSPTQSLRTLLCSRIRVATTTCSPTSTLATCGVPRAFSAAVRRRRRCCRRPLSPYQHAFFAVTLPMPQQQYTHTYILRTYACLLCHAAECFPHAFCSWGLMVRGRVARLSSF
jgi:hypothetical protein